MNATLTFDLNDEDGFREHLRCCKALDMALVLWDIHYRLRNDISMELNNRQKQKGADAVLNRIAELLQDHHINLDELIV